MAASGIRPTLVHVLVLVVALGLGATAGAQQRFPYPTEPVTVAIEVVEDLDEKRAADIRERFKDFAETADLMVKPEGKSFAFAVKKDLKLKWSDLKTTIESTDEAAPLTLGDPPLVGRVRIRLHDELGTPERKSQLASGLSKLRAMAGVTYARTPKDGSLELVISAPGVRLSTARAMVLKVVKNPPEDFDPIDDVVWCGPREAPRVIRVGGCEED